jgi:hypothetical protein
MVRREAAQYLRHVPEAVDRELRQLKSQVHIKTELAQKEMLAKLDVSTRLRVRLLPFVITALISISLSALFTVLALSHR